MSDIDLGLVLTVAVGVVLGVIMLKFLGWILKALWSIVKQALGVLLVLVLFLLAIPVLLLSSIRSFFQAVGKWVGARPIWGPLTMSLSLAALALLIFNLSTGFQLPVPLMLTLIVFAVGFVLGSIWYLMVVLRDLGDSLGALLRQRRAARNSANCQRQRNP